MRIVRRAIIATAMLAAALTPGGTSAIAGAAEAAPKPVRIITSFYPMYIATLNVAKDIPGVEVTNLTQPQTGCLHDYQMTTADMTRLSGADIFVVNGAGMETFLDKVIQQLPRIKVVQASEGIELIKGKGAEGDNPHIWCSPTLYIKQIQNIAAQLAQIDPDRAPQYRKNATDYVARLDQLRATMNKGLENIRTRDIITFHEAFPYFASEFGLHIAAVIEREPGSEPSAKEIAETIEIVKKSSVKALFAEPQYPAKAAETIARETGAKLYTLDPAVTGPMTKDAYIETMERNLSELQKALR
jgi:zinc transport system substrate-binding protein